MEQSEDIIFRGTNISHCYGGVKCSTFIRQLNETLCKMQELVKQGHKIIWSQNENWCTVNGQVFNVSKYVYEKRLDRNGNIILFDNCGNVIPTIAFC